MNNCCKNRTDVMEEREGKREGRSGAHSLFGEGDGLQQTSQGWSPVIVVRPMEEKTDS